MSSPSTRKSSSRSNARLYGERVIHGEIYKARPEVNAVCHHHAPSILPFCISGAELKPVYHLGATLGEKVPFWDGRDEFGDTNLIVAKPEEGASLARALGPHWIVLMRRHGATVAGKTLEELTFRTIYTARNAAMQIQAHTLGYRVAAQRGGDRACRRIQSAAGPGRRAPGNTGRCAWTRWRAPGERQRPGRPRSKRGSYRTPTDQAQEQAETQALNTLGSTMATLLCFGFGYSARHWLDARTAIASSASARP